MKTSLAVGVILLFACAPGVNSAQRPAAAETAGSYPAKPIRLVIPQAPGGSNDIMARYVGGQLAERVGRQVVVDNRPGAEGMIATEIVARAASDGYTLLMASAAFAMNPAVVRKLPYDPIKDFEWAAFLGRSPVVIAVGPSLPVNSLKELLVLGQSKPNYITIASAGGFMHFVSAMFRSHAKMDATIALYKGGAPALIDVMGGHAHMAVPTVVTVIPHLRAGKLRVLATGGTKRISALPDVPTAEEAGLPGYDASIWWAWATPAHVPAAILDKLNTEVAAILKLPETARRFAVEGAEVEMHTPAEIREMIKAELVKWARVAQDAGMPKR